MTIEKSLPFECCEECKEFVLSVNEQAIFNKEIQTRKIVVKCKNEWLCQQLKEKFGNEITKQN